MNAETNEPEASTAKPKHSPLVRRLADEFGVDLALIEGTGANGRITRDDVHRTAFPDEPLPGARISNAAKAAPAAEVEVEVEVEMEVEMEVEPEPEVEAEMEAEPGVGVEAEPGVGDARSTFTVVSVADAAQLERAKERLVSPSGRAMSHDALLVKLVSQAGQTQPKLKASGPDGSIGFCRPADSGMVTDVIPNADSLSLLEIDILIDERTRSHQPGDEPIVAPLTVIDAGNLGATALMAPLMPGGVGSVTFGRRQPTVGLIDGAFQAGLELTITATFDTQAIDVGTACSFIEEVRLLVEDPILAFLT